MDGKSKNLIKKEEDLLNFSDLEQKTSFFNPFLVFFLFSIMGFWITFSDLKKKKRTHWLDFTLFISTGMIGLLIVFLWFFTKHSMTPNNFNFLWAFAPNFLIAPTLLFKNLPKWLIHYSKLLLLFLSIIPMLWIFKIQVFPTAMIPFWLFLAFRYWFLSINVNE